MHRAWCQATRGAGGRDARLSLKSAQRQHFLGVDTRVVSGCAWVCLTLSGNPMCATGPGTSRVVFLSLGVFVCVVWCLWVCLCGLCWCVARHVCVCLISLWLAGPCSCMTREGRWVMSVGSPKSGVPGSTSCVARSACDAVGGVLCHLASMSPVLEGFDPCLNVRCTDPCVTSVPPHVVTSYTLRVTVHHSVLLLPFCLSVCVVSISGRCVCSCVSFRDMSLCFTSRCTSTLGISPFPANNLPRCPHSECVAFVRLCITLCWRVLLSVV